MSRLNYEDRTLQDAIRSLGLTDEQRQALGNYIHRGNSPEGEDFQSCVEFIQDFLRYDWRHYING